MKYIVIALTLFGVWSCQSPSNTSPTQESALEGNKSTMVFDSLLAQEVGADQYGMKPYVFAFLYRGPNRPQEQKLRDSLQRAHMSNIGRLAEEGNLVLAGPMLDPDSDLRGIYIFNTPSIDTATIWTQSDPAIQHGSLRMELMPWYGSAALMKVNNLHKKVAKIEI